MPSGGLRRPCQLRTLSNSELGWLAGWLEGEGWFGKVYQHSKYHSPAITVASIDFDTLEYAQHITGVGKISSGQSKTKPIWYWRVQRWNDAVALMQCVYPLMHERRQAKIREVLEGCSETVPADTLDVR